MNRPNFRHRLLRRHRHRLRLLLLALMDGRKVTALYLSIATGACERTIYRDVAALRTAGFPIEGAAGKGYVLRPGPDATAAITASGLFVAGTP